MGSCIVCYDVCENDKLFKCPGSGCEIKTCESCAEIQVNTGNIKCSCGQDVIDPMMEFYSSDIVKSLSKLSIKREVSKSIDTEIALAEGMRLKKEKELLDMNSNAVKLADMFQSEVMDKCPKCNAPFNCFDGCVALRCSTCTAAFCALCLYLGKCTIHGHISGHLYEAERLNRVNEKLINFVKKHLDNDKTSRLYRLFSSNLNRIGIKTDLINADGPIIVKKFISDCLKQVISRIQDERLSMFDERGRVREEWKVPEENYRVLLEKSNGGDTYWAKIYVKQTVDVTKDLTKVTWVSRELRDLVDDDETVNIKSMYYAVLVDDRTR